MTAIDQAEGSAALPVRTLVLDTNIVLDLFVFDDLRVQPLKAELLDGRLNWLTTLRMRDELERVLGYAHIQARLALIERCALDILANFDRHARRVDVADRAAVTCADPDDQMFIDLAVQHQCILLSKDAAVLALKKKLAVLQVEAGAVLPASA